MLQSDRTVALENCPNRGCHAALRVRRAAESGWRNVDAWAGGGSRLSVSGRGQSPGWGDGTLRKVRADVQTFIFIRQGII